MKNPSENTAETSFYRAFNALLVDCTSLIVQSEPYNFHDRMNEVLEKIGKFSGVDRSYYFKIDLENQTLSNVNEWCKEGVSPQIEYLQEIPYAVVPNWMENMLEGKEIYIEELQQLDEKWAPEKEILEPQGIQSLLSIPIRESNLLYGFLGFDAVETKVQWTEDSRHLLRILANNIGSVIRRNEQNQVLQQRTRELEQVEAELRILNENLEHKVIENTQKYLELTQAYHVQEKLAAIGEIAAGIAHDLNTPISTVATGAELLQQILLELLSKQLDKLTPKEIRNALDLAQNHLREKFISGIQLEKEKQTILEILSTITLLQQSQYNILAEQFARCRILNPEIIRQLVQQPNISAMITLTENIQTAMNLMDTINHSASRSASVIQNLREYITKTDQVEKKSVNLFKSITSALNIFSNSLDRKATIRTEIPSNIYISGNEIKLFQLWSNLIKNALEAVRETRQPELKITANTEAEQVFVYFENNGPAIPEGSITEIFSRFYTTKSAQSGSGLGLTIVQTVVKEHGGTIGIQSDEKATVFKIQLPLKALGS